MTVCTVVKSKGKISQNFVSFSEYRVSHGKVNKVIWLCWGYSFWFWLIFWVLCVHEKGTLMMNSSVFNFLMLRALYGSITQHFLFLNKFWIISLETSESLYWDGKTDLLFLIILFIKSEFILIKVLIWLK